MELPEAEDAAEPDDLIDEEFSGAPYHPSPFVREFRRLESLRNNQQRGYDFEKFVSSLFAQRHFSVILSPKTAKPRQTDLLAKRGDDSFLIETKWRSSKANVADIDALFSRLDSTPATVVGVMISYSGFTEEAIKRVESRSSRPVVLISGDELKRLIEWNEDIAQLLAKKRADLLIYRQAARGEDGNTRRSAKRGNLAAAPAFFVFPDGSREEWISCGGGFGEFTFVQELPDVDWVPSEGRSVMLDMAFPVYDERDVVALLYRLSDMGWATGSARWSIQQSATNWHGIGVRAFVDALSGWRKRYKNLSIHHSEEFCYFDTCDGGFYTFTAKISAYDDRSVEYSMLSFQLSGVPLDADPLKELARSLIVREQCYFRPMERRSVRRKLNIIKSERVPLEPVAFIAEEDTVFGGNREWVRGLVARNPFYPASGRMKDRQPDWIPAHAFDSEFLICDLRFWHPVGEQKARYELGGCEYARTADAVIIRPVAEWPD